MNAILRLINAPSIVGLETFVILMIVSVVSVSVSDGSSTSLPGAHVLLFDHDLSILLGIPW